MNPDSPVPEDGMRLSGESHEIVSKGGQKPTPPLAGTPMLKGSPLVSFIGAVSSTNGFLIPSKAHTVELEEQKNASSFLMAVHMG